MMAATKYLTIDGLTHFKDKLDTLFVKQEEGKGLSQENFTTEFKNHIEAEMSFDGSYTTLTDKPKINGFELTSSTTLSDIDVVESKVEDGDEGVASIKNDASGGVMSYKPTTGKSGLVSVDSGSNSQAKAKVMMRVIDEEYTGASLFGNDNGFYYRKGTGLTEDPQEEIVVKKDIANLATTSNIEKDYAKKSELPKAATTQLAGTVKPDGTTITVTEDGTISVNELSAYLKSETAESTYLKIADYKAATAEEAGKVKPDGTTLEVDESGTLSLKDAASYAKTETVDSTYAKKTELPKVATAETAGTVKIGENITLSEDGTGTISVTFPEGSDDILTKTEAGTTYAKSTDIADMVTTTSLTSTLEPYAKTETVTTSIESAKSDVLEQVNTKIATTYKAKGSKATVTELPAPSADTVGDVYNMSAGFTTDEKFAESGTYYPKGTNVVVADQGGETYKYDALAGDYDLSIYLKTADVEAITNGEIDALFAE